MDDLELGLGREGTHATRRILQTRDQKYIQLLEGDTVYRYCGVEHVPPEELYDLKADPSESDNHAAGQSQRIDELREKISEQLSGLLDASDPNGRASEYSDEEETIKRFKLLGYR